MPDTSPRLHLKQIARHTSSYVDPNGFLFEHDGELYRAINTAHGPFYKTLFANGTIAKLTAKGLVPSEIAPLTIAAPEIDFVINHKRISPDTFCVEWCPAMLQDAARLTLDMLEESIELGGTLQDAYPWNILFDGPDPIFLDLTSIAPREPGLIWPAYEQFQAFFLRPLELSAQGKGSIARHMLFDNINGISFENFWTNTNTGYKFTHPGQAFAAFLTKRLRARPDARRKLKNKAATERKIPVALLKRFCRGLQKKVRSFDFTSNEDVWSVYYQEIDAGVDTKKKLTIIGDLLDRLSPKTVLDAGCNIGVFSLEAAKRGAKVMSIDSSEESINRLFTEAKKQNMPVTPVVSDLLSPTPAFGFLAQQYPSLIDRAQSDTVLALALMHHLHIPGRQSFERIAKFFDTLAKRNLIFEFVAMDDANNDLIGAGREIQYTLEDVMDALKVHFPTIEVLESDRPTRRILLCSKES